MLLIYMLKNKGAKIDPWGKPSFMVNDLLVVWPRVTVECWFLSIFSRSRVVFGHQTVSRNFKNVGVEDKELQPLKKRKNKKRRITVKLSYNCHLVKFKLCNKNF